MKKRVLPTSEPNPDKRPPATEADGPVIIVAPEVSAAIFSLYDGKKITERVAHEARMLAAIWQVAVNLNKMHQQSLINTAAIIEAIRTPACPGCGK